MKDPIKSLRSETITQLGEIDRDLTTAVARVTSLKVARRKAAKSLKALDDIEAGKPAPKQAQVQLAIEQLLIENGGAVAAEDLEGLVAEKLDREEGCSAMGLALRLREIMATNKFVTIEGEVFRSPDSETKSINSRGDSR